MRVLEKSEPTISNHCILCGNGLDRNRMDIIIDVQRDLELPGHPLDGRLYIGQCCVWDFAKAAGLLTANQLNDAKDYLRSYRNSVEATMDRVEEFLGSATEMIGTLPAPPNLDHLDTPANVLAAELAHEVDERAKADWVEVSPDGPPF